MGNYASCNSSCSCISTTSSSSQRAPKLAASESRRKLAEKAVMVVHSMEERVMVLGGGTPMKVAELMLEFPGHFVVQCETDSSEMLADVKRATPLPADHEALPGRIYMVFPMHRLHTRVAPRENASYKSLVSSHILMNSNLQQLLSCSKKKILHSIVMQASSARVTPLSALHFSADDEEEEDHVPSHLTASRRPHDVDDADALMIDDEIDSLLQHFCSYSQNIGNASAFINKSGSLVRSKSWMPKLETINESSILVV